METQSVEATQPAVETETAKEQQIKANFDNKVDLKPVRFRFRKITDKESGVETQRPAVELPNVPVPSVEGLIAIIEKGGNGLQLLLEAAGDIVINRARELVDEKEDITPDTFPLDQLAWEVIANLPKAERRGNGISKEVWEDFTKDYLAIMPGVTGKNAEALGLATKIYANKFASVKTNKPVLGKLKEQLGLYISNTPNAEQFAECVDFLVTKATNLLNVDEAALLENL